SATGAPCRASHAPRPCPPERRATPPFRQRAHARGFQRGSSPGAAPRENGAVPAGRQRTVRGTARAPGSTGKNGVAGKPYSENTPLAGQSKSNAVHWLEASHDSSSEHAPDDMEMAAMRCEPAAEHGSPPGQARGTYPPSQKVQASSMRSPGSHATPPWPGIGSQPHSRLSMARTSSGTSSGSQGAGGSASGMSTARSTTLSAKLASDRRESAFTLRRSVYCPAGSVVMSTHWQSAWSSSSRYELASSPSVWQS